MTEIQVVELMKSSKSKDDWNANCDKVKAAFNGQYPPFWYPSIVISGVAKETALKWGGDAEIKIIAI